MRGGLSKETINKIMLELTDPITRAIEDAITVGINDDYARTSLVREAHAEVVRRVAERYAEEHYQKIVGSIDFVGLTNLIALRVSRDFAGGREK